MELKLENKVAIITGASKGMGRSVVKSFLKEGLKVMMISRNEENLRKLFEDLSNDAGNLDYIVGDVADLSLADIVVEKTLSRWGRVDILINNAGGPPPGSFLTHDANAWEVVLQTNLLSVIRFSKAVAPAMKSNNWGRIISITSTISKEPTSGMVLSATARAGVSAFTKAISSELAEFGITVNVVCPGGVLTDRLVNLVNERAVNENRSYTEVLTESQATIPAKRFATPEEIASTILFLSSDAAGYITGVSLTVDGGLTKSF